MAYIEVISPGMLTTVQDLGRPGWGPLGVSPGGAADPASLRMGNRLAGNPENTPALEMTLKGGVFRFPGGAVVALAGAEMEGAVPWTTLHFREGGELVLRTARSGLRTYLCVHGGIDVPRVLGSASAHLPSGIGGGPLRKGQLLRIGAPHLSTVPIRSASDAVRALLAPRPVLRVVPGPQASLCDLTALLSTAFEVRPDSDRTGLRLRGRGAPNLRGSAEMTTEGVSLGAIQIPPTGEPIILFVDQQTTGGYPVAANVIAADLSSVGQLRPGDTIRFEPVSLEDARKIFFEQEQALW